MKEIVTYYAACNRQINALMNSTIQGALPKPYELPLEGYYFKTLGQILDHILCTDLIWMKAFSDLESCGMDLVKEVREVPGYGDQVFSDFEAYLPSRQSLDAFICRYMERVDEAIFAKAVTRKTRDGLVIEKNALKAMVHFFNHQTHHRGQISHVLDTLGIENNYSNMIFLDL